MLYVGESDPHQYQMRLRVLNVVWSGVVGTSQQGYGLCSQSRCPYLGDRWGKGKEDMGTGTNLVSYMPTQGNVLRNTHGRNNPIYTAKTTVLEEC